MSCSYAPSSAIASSSSSSSSYSNAVCPRIRHLVSGTFNSPFLHLLSFDTLTRTLSLLSTLPGYGPHSFLAVGRTASADNNEGKLVDTVYATTWAQDRPELIAWRVKWQHEDVQTLEWLGNVPITATSSYVHVQPPPYHSLTTPSYGQEDIGPSKHLFSAGGPTGEVHNIDPNTGAILDKSQEIIFLKGGEKDLPSADKSRRALRYGVHSVDVGPDNLAYFADVGRNSFLVYRYDANSIPSSSSSGDERPLKFLNEIPSPESHDGPRHVVPSYTGKYVFVVTEHTSYVDVFQLLSSTDATFKHTQRVSILPENAPTNQYRGDTVRLSPDGKSLFATTRGMTTSIKGLVKVWNLDEETADGQVLTEKLSYTALNSGGKAHAIEFAPRYSQDPSSDKTSIDWAVFTDDQEGYISVLQWDGHDLQDVARIQLPPLENGEAQGASQAVWLS